MSLSTLIESDPLIISYDEENQWLYADWQGELGNTQIKEGVERLLTCLQQTPCRKILNDNSNVIGATWYFSEWVAQDAMPRLAEAGLQYIAWVLSPSLECRLYADQAVGLTKTPLAAVFDELIGAHQWLRYCEQWFPAQRYLGTPAP
ncbi:hypothetical protein [Hymenobacter crusticola]|uniref:STAS/SEC14 domain-containing protein n=1 Tax=Hymenobacter crusticola TaxID=1770526 RepID=A0A243WFF4_9BACT|nr:hypothetical protein [Hymenobacter crusticola]OUJ74220.1 hypothetical protein BXP70_10860 [Hymenobacter crusticola]